MREIYLKYRDHELFETMYMPEHYHFILTHMDAFKHMWTKQGKSFWCKHLLMYRHHCCNFGTLHLLIKENVNPLNMPVECLTVLADQIFIILYNEFVNCRYGTARDFITDLTLLIANKNLVMACRNSSITKSPFCMTDTRDVFRKLLGSCRSYPQGMKEFYLLCLSYPIYGIFGGSIYHVLRRWINACDVSIPVETYLQKCWECPPELRTSTFVPQSFHRHMLEKNGDQVDSLLFHGCFGLFSSSRFPHKQDVFDPNATGDKQPSFTQLFESFVEYVSSREWFPSDKVCEDELNSDFKEYLNEKLEDFEDEEFRRSMILKLAEKRFQEEMERDSKNKESESNKSGKSVKTCQCNLQKKTDKCTGKCTSKKQSAKHSNQDATVVLSNKSSEPQAATTSKKKAPAESGETISDGGAGFIAGLIHGLACTSESLPSDSSKSPEHSTTVSLNDKRNASGTVDFKDKLHSLSTSLVTKECPHTAKKKKNKNKKKKGLEKEVSADVKSGVYDKSREKEPVRNSQVKREGGAAQKPETSGKPVNSANVKNTQPQNMSTSAGTKNTTSTVDTSKASTDRLERIKRNIDTIKQNVQEQSALSIDGFRLMVETGSLLMSSDSNQMSGNSKALQNCSQCSKLEEKPKTFKKCSRCKAENVKWVRYYCSRECQAKNWIDCHQEEHENDLLAKK